MFLVLEVSVDFWGFFGSRKAFLHMQPGKSFCALYAALPVTKDLELPSMPGVSL